MNVDELQLIKRQEAHRRAGISSTTAWRRERDDPTFQASGSASQSRHFIDDCVATRTGRSDISSRHRDRAEAVRLRRPRMAAVARQQAAALRHEGRVMRSRRNGEARGETGAGKAAKVTDGNRSLPHDRREFQDIGGNNRRASQPAPQWREPAGARALRLMANLWRPPEQQRRRGRR